MKLTGLLLSLAVFCANLKSGYAKSTSDELLERAASQLERLSAFRRTIEPQRAVIKVQPQDNVYQTFPAEVQQTEDIIEAQKRIDKLKASASELLQDPRYQAMMQDRIKRSFISGIANKLVGGVVGVASGASRGIAGLSSSNTPSEYGSYGHSYQTNFDIGDFTKAIINTLVQAIKAIGGGAIAGGGALVKGGGYLVSAKGQIISSAGSAISSLGKAIASSAIIASPKPVYGHPGYSYNAPSPQEPSHDLTYDGPPPSAYAGSEDGYNAGHSGYASPSNDDGEDDQAGVLIVKETKPGHDHDDRPSTSSVHELNPSLSALEDSFGGPSKGPSSTITKITAILNSGQPTVSDHDHLEEEKPSSHHSNENGENHGNPNYQSYQLDGEIYDSYGKKLQSYSPQLTNGQYTEGNQAGQDHQTLEYQQIQTSLEVPKLQDPTIFKDISSFADYHYHGNEHQSEPLKIPILPNNHNSFDHSHDNQVGTMNYYGLPNYGNGQIPIGLETESSQLPIYDYNNYQLHNTMGFDQHIQHPAPPNPGGPALLGVWGRISTRTNRPMKKVAIIGRGLEIQRASGYSLMNGKLTRI